MASSVRRSYAFVASGSRQGSGSKGRDGEDGEDGNDRNDRNDRNDGNDGKDKASSRGQAGRASPHKQSTRSPSHSKISGSKSSAGPNGSPSRGRSRSPKSSSSSTTAGPYTASEYIRAPGHIPNTRQNGQSPSPNGDTETHYILTFDISPKLHDYMTALRKRYFPAEINKLDAHVTLFHALPGSKLDRITSDITDLCARESTFSVAAGEPYSPRSTNILVPASSPRFALEGVRKTLQTRWASFLSEQDNNNAGYKPHWTVMNKVSDRHEVERKLHELKSRYEPRDGRVHGLVLWRYDRGWWRDRRAFEFRGR